jgi:hypothetical protein
VTAEVMICNRLAVALAADSAVTVGEGDSGKIYNTVNKLFTLSKHRPVGIMIFANADYMGVPLETVIKMYREGLGATRFENLRSYSSDFVKSLAGRAFNSDAQQAGNVRRTWQVAFDSVNDDIREEVEAELRQRNECPTKRLKEIVLEQIEAHLFGLEKCDVSPGFERKTPTRIVRQYKDQYEAAKGGAGIERYNQTIARAWKKLAGLVITRDHWYQTYSGIVVAGFGEDDVFPQFVVMQEHGIVAGVHKHQVVSDDGISHETTSVIRPFAQTEMVHRFMDGVDRSYLSYIDGAMTDALAGVAKGIIDVHVKVDDSEKEKIKGDVDKVIESQVQELRNNARQWRRSKFVDPVLDAVDVLPKDELAKLAEALVDLTSIKRRVSTERETVGGPIDVAVISKGDGFIWIKRKHYFKSELNPHFANNYQTFSRKEQRRGKS